MSGEFTRCVHATIFIGTPLWGLGETTFGALGVNRDDDCGANLLEETNCAAGLGSGRVYGVARLLLGDPGDAGLSGDTMATAATPVEAEATKASASALRGNFLYFAPRKPGDSRNVQLQSYTPNGYIPLT